MPFNILQTPVAINANLSGENELYQLRDDFNLQYKDELGETHSIHIPAGFICDGSSIPRILWTVIGLHKDGKNREPSLVHDWLYMHQGRIPEGTYTRFQADRLYYDLLLAYGVSHKKALRSFKGVLWFGGKHWRNVDEKLIRMNRQIPSLQRVLVE